MELSKLNKSWLILLHLYSSHTVKFHLQIMLWQLMEFNKHWGRLREGKFRKRKETDWCKLHCFYGNHRLPLQTMIVLIWQHGFHVISMQMIQLHSLQVSNSNIQYLQCSKCKYLNYGQQLGENKSKGRKKEKFPHNVFNLDLVVVIVCYILLSLSNVDLFFLFISVTIEIFLKN